MVSEKKIETYDGDLLVFFQEKIEAETILCHPLIQNQVARARECGDFSGKESETLLFYPDSLSTEGRLLAKRVLVVGLGESLSHGAASQSEMDGIDHEGWGDKKSGTGKEGASGQEDDVHPEADSERHVHEDDDTLRSSFRESCRQVGGTIAKTCAAVKADKIMIVLPEGEKGEEADVAECITEGILLGDYRFLKYKTENKEKDDDTPRYVGLTEVRCHPVSGSLPMIRKSVKLGVVAAQAACDARDMANEPGNGWKASDFAAYAEELSKRHGFTYTFFDKAKLQELKMGGILAVNQGSKEAPGLVILEYRPKKKSQTILLVGKGITFDSGGICVKPAAGMQDMKYDMCGGAAVLAAMQAVGQEKPGVGVVAIVPATDNLSGSDAIKPGDIIRHYDGTTSEIVNTDAEGRMILADALAYGIETYQPDCVVDIATLTGAVIMGLGHHYSGMISNHDGLVAHLEAAGKRAGEPLWRLPLDKPYRKQIESKVADIKNTGGKSAGTITAGAYLEHFVGKTPWVHIDIAGTAWDFTEKSYIPKGPSGIGVRTFVELIRNWKNEIV